MIVEIWSDVVCPWCYIGKRRLERALGSHPDLEIEVHWRAFQLNPEMPSEGIERQLYLELKFGGPAAAQRIYDTIAEAGTSERIPFAFDKIRRTPSTIDAHRLIRRAGAILLYQRQSGKGRRAVGGKLTPCPDGSYVNHPRDSVAVQGLAGRACTGAGIW